MNKSPTKNEAKILRTTTFAIEGLDRGAITKLGEIEESPILEKWSN